MLRCHAGASASGAGCCQALLFSRLPLIIIAALRYFAWLFGFR